VGGIFRTSVMHMRTPFFPVSFPFHFYEKYAVTLAFSLFAGYIIQRFFENRRDG